MNFLKNIKNKITSLFSTKKTVEKKTTAKKHVTKKPVSKAKAALRLFGLIAFCAFILILSIRGLPGNPNPVELNSMQWKDNGPLELSPERGRYALTYAFVELNSVVFTPDIGRFAAPDVAYKDGKYLSLFAPGVSVLAIPGYMLGKAFGLAQVGAFAIVSVFAIMNVLLIRKISMHMGASSLTGSIAGLTFLFASPAFAYAVTLYQHHISTFLILSCIYLLIRFNSFWSLFLIWLLIAASLPVDYPNFFMMLPIGFFALGKLFFKEKVAGKIQIRIPMLRLLTFTSMILPMALFLWFNSLSYGSPFTLSGNVERALVVNPDGSPQLETDVQIAMMKKKGQPVEQFQPTKNMLNAFLTRNLMNGMYEHFTSMDRGMLLFTPVMLVGGFAGLIFAIKRRIKYVGLLTAVIGFNVLLYSMWGDPYGGWAFGSRYLIPTYALLAVFIALLLTRYAKNIIVLLLFFIFLGYSVGVNTLGALTSNRNPPKIEAVGLSKITHREEPYTYERNARMLDINFSKSYVHHTYFANIISAWNYYGIVTMFILIVTATMLVRLKFVSKGADYEV